MHNISDIPRKKKKHVFFFLLMVFLWLLWLQV